MATYNGGRFLRAQIDSILAQLCPGDELLVADDASDDDTVAILMSYGAALSVVDSSRAGGVVRNFERALNFASGEIVLLADQDDVWLPGRLARLREELATCDLVVANGWVVDASLAGGITTVFELVSAAPGALRNWALGPNSFVGCCIAFRRDLLRLALPFPASTPWHDWLLGLLATLTGTVRFIDEPLLLFRRHSANASQTGASKNGVAAKAWLRLRIACAVATCLFRPRRRQG